MEYSITNTGIGAFYLVEDLTSAGSVTPLMNADNSMALNNCTQCGTRTMEYSMTGMTPIPGNRISTVVVRGSDLRWLSNSANESR